MTIFQEKQLDEALLKIKECQERARKLGVKDAIVQENNLLLLGYKAIVEEVAAETRAKAKILDWGGGFGFLSFLLQSLRKDVTYCDFRIEDKRWTALLEELKIPKVYLENETAIPFSNESFDIIISCGVLEHTSDPDKSLDELLRILKPKGTFFIYHFSNRFSYTEYFAKWLGQEIHHYKLSKRELISLLNRHGFAVASFCYKYLLPRNLPRFPLIRALFSSRADLIFFLDRFLCTLPGLNLFSTTINVKAVKQATRNLGNE